MGKPAARVGDMHVCPMLEPDTGTPHEGGVIKEPGNLMVLIGGKAAAVLGDACTCPGLPNTIIGGSTGVFIGGKPAARRGDSCAHGGVITEGLESVLIGERGNCRLLLREKIISEENELIDELISEEKNKQINTAIYNCITLLERKLQLLESRDENTMKAFEKWFGSVNEFEVQTTIFRIENALNVAKELTTENFKVIVDEHTKIYSSAMVWSMDEFHTIFLGDLFWDKEHLKDHSQELILIHELSHFDYVGTTSDFGYGTTQCLDLTKNYPKKALFNAESFECFIKS